MVFQQISIGQNRTQFATSDKLMQSWDSGSRYESPIGLQWWFIMGYLRTWQDSSNNGAHWQSHRTRSGMELRMRVTYLQYLEMFAIQESFVHVHRRPWRFFFAFFATAMVPSNGEVLKHRSTNKINFKVAKSRDWSQGRDAERKFLVSLRVWGLRWFVAKCILSAVLFYSNYCIRITSLFHVRIISCQFITKLSISCRWELCRSWTTVWFCLPWSLQTSPLSTARHQLGASVSHKHRCQEPAKSFSILSPIYVIVIQCNSYCHSVKIKMYHNQKDL